MPQGSAKITSIQEAGARWAHCHPLEPTEGRVVPCATELAKCGITGHLLTTHVRGSEYRLVRSPNAKAPLTRSE